MAIAAAVRGAVAVAAAVGSFVSGLDPAPPGGQMLEGRPVTHIGRTVTTFCGNCQLVSSLSAASRQLIEQRELTPAT